MPISLRPDRRHAFRHSLLAMACAAAAAPAWSQTVPPPSDQTPQRVEVTGSRIKQVDAEGASPVETITREDIKRTGATSVRELLDTVTASSTNGATINDVNGSNTFSPGASQGSLRNLGAQSTLLLLNGRRIALYPLPNFQETFSNLDTLPLEAVDRIEILKTGGSAVYGSDAIAGVINVITRNNYQGLQVDASTQQSLRNGHFGERTVSVTGGVGDYATDGFNILGNVEFFHRDQLFWNKVLGSVNPRYAEVSPSYGTPSTYSYPGNIIGSGAIPGCQGEIKGSYCYYDRYERFEAVPKTDRVNGLLSGHLRIDDKTDLYAELLVSHITAQYQNAYSAYGPAQGYTQWLNPNTGLQNTFYYRGLPADHPLNPTGEDDPDFRYRFVDSDAHETTQTNQFRALTGLKGSYLDWDYDTAIGVMGGKTHDRSRGQFSNSGFLTEIGDYNLSPLDPTFFNVPGGYQIGQVNSPEVLNTLFPQYGWNAKTRQYFLDGNATKPIMDLPAGPLTMSAGFELRHESMVLTPTANLANSDIVGYSYSSSDAARSFGALFTEFNIPIVKNLDLGLAGRLDKFPHFGAHFSPRANLRYQPISDLLFRGTIETGFRAPNLQESSTSTKTAYTGGVNDPQRCPAANAIANDLRAQAAQTSDPDEQAYLLAYADSVYGNECSESVSIIAINNPDLKPERSLSKSIGTVFQLGKHANVSIDYWTINRKNEINLKSVQDLLTAEGSQAPGVVVRNPLDPTGNTDPTFTGDQIDQYGITAGPLSSIKLQYGNLFETRTSGVDLGASGDVMTPIGKFTAAGQATYTANYQVYSPTRNTTGGWGDNLAGRYGYPRWSFNITNTLVTGDFSNTLRYTHQSGQSLQSDFDDTIWTQSGCLDQGLTTEQCTLKSYNRWDYLLSWSGIKNLTVSAFVQNVFNQRPPVDYRAFGGASGIIPVSNEDAAGRVLKLAISYKFL